MKNARALLLCIAVMLPGLFCLFAGGCSTLSTQQNATITCGAVGSALQVLTVARSQGKLSTSEVTAINQAISVTEPVCTAPIPPDSATLKSDVFQTAANSLLQMAVTKGTPKS